MNPRAWHWAILGIPGARELALVALITLVLYGRSGLQIARRTGGLPPWLSPFIRRPPPSPSPSRAKAAASPPPEAGASRRGDRVFWFLAILAATAVAAWIVTRTLIVASTSPSN